MPLSYIPQAQPGQETTPQAASGAAPQDDPIAQVEALLRSLEMAPMPKPAKAKLWQNIVGSLGDAIMAMASVRAGGGPGEGPFARSQRERRMEFEKQGA